MWNKAIACVVLIIASSAVAQVTPLIFERETIKIVSPTPKEGAENPPPVHPVLAYDVEIRPEDALRLEYIHTLNNMTDATGVMIAFAAPSVVALPALQVPTAVDALFVLDNGTITQILPNVVLADLTQEVAAPVPVKAFLFLKAGQVAARGIRPHDIITGKRFTPPPPVLQ